MSENSSNGGGGMVALGLFLVVLTLATGVGLYYVAARQQAIAAAAIERTRAAEAVARIQAEQAQAKSSLAVATHGGKPGADSSANEGSPIRANVESVLRHQEDAWNRGDLNAFMEHYWKSDELTFSSEGRTTRGWNATSKRYHERYGSPEKMGRLALSGFEVTPLGESASFVLGQWKLERESEPVAGNFTLVLRKFDDRWLIVHDHTSRLPNEEQ